MGSSQWLWAISLNALYRAETRFAARLALQRHQQSVHEGLVCCQLAAIFYMLAEATMGFCGLISVKLLFGYVVFFQEFL